MSTARQVAAFLRASWDRSIDSAGRIDVLIGLIVALIGAAVHVDLVPLGAAIVLAVLLIRLLVLSPAKMWAGRAEADEPSNVVVQSGATYIENYYAAGSHSESAGTATTADADTATGIGSAYDATVRIEPSPAAPRSRRRTKRGPKSPPPSQGS